MIDAPIIVYHQISSGPLAREEGSLTISVQRFERQMRYLYEHRYHCLTLTELLQSSRNGWVHRRKSIAMTFDDGDESFNTLAYPILQRYGFRATVFLITDRIRERENSGTETAVPFLSWTQIESLQDNGISFGSHTCTHPRLPQLTNAQLRWELFSSKKHLEERLGKRIRVLAYPYGVSNLDVQQMAEAAGYEAACGIRKGKSGRFNLWRTQCQANDTLLDFVFRLTKWPNYVNVIREETKIGQFFRRVKHAINR